MVLGVSSMKRREENASLFDGSFGSTQQGYSSSMKLMMIVAAFLIVTIGLILIQPDPTPSRLAGDEDELTEMTKSAALIDAPSATYPNYEVAVTRSETSLLSVGGAVRSEDVSKRCLG